jgi:phosphoglycolate phosphatase-like HAD superfamily hydrolase
MREGKETFAGAVVSDWNECLAPCGPFDCIGFVHPGLKPELGQIFQEYTGNRISLTEASRRVRSLLPAGFTPDQMDRYLEREFSAYPGVPELIHWCRDNRILFMINTTGMTGYFQRVFSAGLLPPVDVLAANPAIEFSGSNTDPVLMYPILEIEDKPVCTEHALHRHGIPSSRAIIVGDSGGDGPHFAWGARSSAFLVASMIKPSLRRYCQGKDIRIDLCFGRSYREGESKDREGERRFDFRDLIPAIARRLDLEKGS